MILLLLTLTCCVCGTFETSYEAEENEDVTLEWTFTPADRSLDALNIDCAKVTNQKHWVLFRLADGVQVPESQDAQFAGRVHFDKDVLGEGRLRLNVTSLRVEDSGDYLCEYGEVPDVRRLTVRARRSETEPERRSTESWGWKDFISNLGMISGLVALLIALCLNIYACWRPI
ncbi:coxsackievirus and adenovirus receptor homolog isoform X2 [Labrus mixtus]|uniref:coxsackievirus and adenovirus receptor homolog isoform X2 n=1 Tax=Labrus mixtus TaxID=508554 RepID=UPI0029C0FA1D|nr:coxsackievirus and adenovirus receptor homolog isoform X2 [Labrus mixtus]